MASNGWLLVLGMGLAACAPAQKCPAAGSTTVPQIEPLAAADTPNESEASAPAALPSWNDTPTRAAIVDFVQRVTQKDGPDFVPAAERIAVFDNDGTLWSEQPLYVQLAFVFARVHALAPEHPEWKKQQPFKAVLEGDMAALAAAGDAGLMQLLVASTTGMTSAEFTVDDGPNKPAAIEQLIGRRPIFAAGNSDGDLQMLQWTAAGTGPSLQLLVHHTDGEREVAYDKDSSIGHLEAALSEARARGWTVVDMAADWAEVFAPAQPPPR